MVRVLGIGDNTVDLYVDQGEQFPGGNAVNVAVLTHRLGGESSYLGCLGTDFAGQLIRDSLIAEGVDISRCRYIERPNSWSRIRHASGDRYFDGSDPGPRHEYALGPGDFDYIATHDLAHSSVYSLLDDELGRIRSCAGQLSFDYSDRRDQAYLALTAPDVDVAFLSHPTGSDDECRQLARFVSSLGPRVVVVTRGSRGALGYDGAQFREQPIVRAEVVDTLGAGDAFIAAFLMEFLAGSSISPGLRRGAEYAAKVCGYRGAFGYGVPIRAGQPGTNPADTKTRQTRIDPSQQHSA
jgi:fructoselysine 6-kinase